MKYVHHLKNPEVAKQYEEDVLKPKDYYLGIMHKAEKKIVQEILKDMKNKVVLDFACGTGRITRLLDSKTKKTYGIDASEEGIKIAKKYCKNTTFLVGDFLEEKNLKIPKLDCIFTFRFLLNTPQREKAIRFFSRNLKKGGCLVFDIHKNTTSFDGIKTLLLNLFSSHKRKVISFHEIKRLLEKNGFEIKKYWGIGLLPHYGKFTIFPKNINTKIENKITNHKLFRRLCFDMVIVAEKIK